MNAVPAGPFPHVYRPTRWVRCASFISGRAIIVGGMISFYPVWRRTTRAFKRSGGSSWLRHFVWPVLRSRFS